MAASVYFRYADETKWTSVKMKLLARTWQNIVDCLVNFGITCPKDYTDVHIHVCSNSLYTERCADLKTNYARKRI